MTHFPERRSQLLSQVATACHLRMTTCFIIRSLDALWQPGARGCTSATFGWPPALSFGRLTHYGSLAQGDALAPRSDFHVTYFFYNKLFIKSDKKNLQHGWRCTCDVSFIRVRVTTVAVAKPGALFWVWLSRMQCTCALFYHHPWPARPYYTFPPIFHFLYNFCQQHFSF